MPETAYIKSRFRAPEIEHRYGPQVHLLDDPLAWTQLARACSQGTKQPELGRLVKVLYERLAEVVLAAEFPRIRMDIATRMVVKEPDAVVRGQGVSPNTKAVTVGIARAGTMPSQCVYDLLNDVLDPAGVRQDHLFMSRETDANGKVIGATWHDAKIGKDIDDRILLLPDPMGATGSSMVSAIDHYKQKLIGTPQRIITMHLIVTPEYLKRVLGAHPEAIVYSLRLDRGKSPTEVLKLTPGERWDEERGLDDHDYIVPGAGGVGELLNNAWV